MFDENIWRLLEEVDDDYDDFNDPDQRPFTEKEKKVAKEIFSLIQSLICEDDIITEEFESKNCLNRHYHKHCLNGYEDRVSTRQNVFYDFKNRDKYRVYGDKIGDLIKQTSNIIPTVNDLKLTYKHIRRLFEGNYPIRFSTSCGFTNKLGPICIGLYSFSSNVTTNYKGQNTIDLLIMSPQLKIISIYPVDANYFENKFNNILKKNNINIQLKINY